MKLPRSKRARERIGQGPIGRFSLGNEVARERKGSVPLLGLDKWQLQKVIGGTHTSGYIHREIPGTCEHFRSPWKFNCSSFVITVKICLPHNSWIHQLRN